MPVLWQRARDRGCLSLFIAASLLALLRQVVSVGHVSIVYLVPVFRGPRHVTTIPGFGLGLWIARAFGCFYQKNLIYQALKSVRWCFTDRTALASASASAIGARRM